VSYGSCRQADSSPSHCPLTAWGWCYSPAWGLFLSVVAEFYGAAGTRPPPTTGKRRLRATRLEQELLASLLEHAEQPFAMASPTGGWAGSTTPSSNSPATTPRNCAPSTGPPRSRRRNGAKWRSKSSTNSNRTGQPVRYQKEYLRQDGSRVPIELLVHLVRAADGTPDYIFLPHRHHRAKRAEAALRESEERLRETNAELLATNHSLVESRTAAVKTDGRRVDARQQAEQAAEVLRLSEARLATFAKATF